MEAGMKRRLLGMLATAMAAALWFPAPDARAEEAEVDVALVLAVDVSRSMDPDEQELQRQGFMDAFRSPVVHDAIRNGMLGRIIVTYMEWSGVEHQNVIVPWTIIDGPESAVVAEVSGTIRSAACGDLDFRRDRFRREAARSDRRRADPPGHRRFGRRPQQQRARRDRGA